MDEIFALITQNGFPVVAAVACAFAFYKTMTNMLQVFQEKLTEMIANNTQAIIEQAKAIASLTQQVEETRRVTQKLIEVMERNGFTV